VSLFKYSLKLWSQVAYVVAVPEDGRVGFLYARLFSIENMFLKIRV